MAGAYVIHLHCNDHRRTQDWKLGNLFSIVVLISMPEVITISLHCRVRSLLEHGTDINLNARDRSSETPSQLGACHGYAPREIVELLSAYSTSAES
jgi:hypothetical protein